MAGRGTVAHPAHPMQPLGQTAADRRPKSVAERRSFACFRSGARHDLRPQRGRLAQLARASARQAEGHRFDSCNAHHSSSSAAAAGRMRRVAPWRRTAPGAPVRPSRRCHGPERTRMSGQGCRRPHRASQCPAPSPRPDSPTRGTPAPESPACARWSGRPRSQGRLAGLTAAGGGSCRPASRPCGTSPRRPGRRQAPAPCDHATSATLRCSERGTPCSRNEPPRERIALPTMGASRQEPTHQHATTVKTVMGSLALGTWAPRDTPAAWARGP